MGKFNLENQYQLYLKRVGLNETEMSEIQRTETRRAFMGACGQLLMLFRDDISALEEDEAIKQLESLINQVQAFWLKETHQTN